MSAWSSMDARVPSRPTGLAPASIRDAVDRTVTCATQPEGTRCVGRDLRGDVASSGRYTTAGFYLARRVELRNPRHECSTGINEPAALALVAAEQVEIALAGDGRGAIFARSSPAGNSVTGARQTLA